LQLCAQAQFLGIDFVRLAQFAGMAMTAAVVTGVDLPLGWAMAVAVGTGAAMTFVVTLILQRK
jgi:hypothetical protein